MGSGSTAFAQWYNGDFDNRNGGNVSVNTGFNSTLYDDFNVTGAGWNVNGVFMNVLSFSGGDFTALNWEIRSGVSAGNGGTLVASGSGSPTNTLTGRSGFGANEFHVLVTGLNVNLAPGTYWLGGGVVSASSNNSQFVSTTSGANAVGTPAGNNGNSFWNSTTFGANWLPTSDAGLFGSGTWDLSMGVNAQPVPEPASMIVLGIGAAAIAVRRRKKTA